MYRIMFLLEVTLCKTGQHYYSYLDQSPLKLKCIKGEGCNFVDVIVNFQKCGHT